MVTYDVSLNSDHISIDISNNAPVVSTRQDASFTLRDTSSNNINQTNAIEEQYETNESDQTDIFLNFKDVSNEIDDNYMFEQTNLSNIIDIIGIYVRGQKILYTEAKTVCELRLTCLMLPSIFFTVTCSIINLLIQDKYGKPISSILNGAIAFILALINYLKLDARAEAHRVSAYKYDKLISYIEFQSGKMLFFTNTKSQLNNIIEYIEGQIKEIKETNPFVLPEIIRYKFSNLASINVFTEVKKIANDEIVMKNRIMNIMNQIKVLEIEASQCTTLAEFNEIKNTVDILTIKKNMNIEEVLLLQKKYMNINKIFDAEITAYSERNKRKCNFICNWLKV